MRIFSVPRIVNTLAHANTSYPTPTPCRAAESDPGGLTAGGGANRCSHSVQRTSCLALGLQQLQPTTCEAMFSPCLAMKPRLPICPRQNDSCAILGYIYSVSYRLQPLNFRPLFCPFDHQLEHEHSTVEQSVYLPVDPSTHHKERALPQTQAFSHPTP